MMNPSKKLKVTESPAKPNVGESLHPDAAQMQFQRFIEFVEAHGPFDIVIDGANVGYYGLSCWESTAEPIPVAVPDSHELHTPSVAVETPAYHPQPAQPNLFVAQEGSDTTATTPDAAPVQPQPSANDIHVTAAAPARAPGSTPNAKGSKQRPPTALREARGALTQCIKDNDADRAVEIFLRYMEQQSTTPTIDMIANVLHLCATVGKADEGFRIFKAYKEDTRDKPVFNERCYAALIKLHCLAATTADVDEAIALLERMKENGTPLKNRSYHPIFACCELLNSASKAMEVYRHALASGLELRETELAYVIRICMKHGDYRSLHDVLLEMKSYLPYASFETFTLLEETFTPANGLCTSHVTIDESGSCPSCSTKLYVEDITAEERDGLLQDLTKLVVQPRIRSGKTATTAPRYAFIDSVLKEASHDGRKVLLVLHSRHLRPDRIPVEARPMVEQWQASGLVYATPYLMNDDYFWLYAALWSTHRAQGLVVTNDHMRDHHFQMLSQAHFPKWREAHRVRLSSPLTGLPPPTVDQATQDGTPSTPGDLLPPRLTFPACYTTCIQCAPCSAEEPQAPTMRWHFPTSKSDDGTVDWLCVGPPVK